MSGGQTQRVARAAANRIGAGVLLRAAGWGACAGGTLGVVLVAGARGALGGWAAEQLHGADAWLLAGGAAGAAIIAGAAVGAARWPTARAGARRLDDVLSLRDALTSAMDVSPGAGMADGSREDALLQAPVQAPVHALVLRDAERVAADVDVRRAVPVRGGSSWRAGGVAIAAAAAACAWLPPVTWPGSGGASAPSRVLPAQRVEEAVASASKAGEALAKSDDPLVLREQDAISAVARELATPGVRAASAARALESGAESLERAGMRERERAASLRDELAARARAEKDSPAQPLAESLRQGNLERAAEEADALRREWGGLSPAEQAQAERDLKDLADAVDSWEREQQQSASEAQRQADLEPKSTRDAARDSVRDVKEAPTQAREQEPDASRAKEHDKTVGEAPESRGAQRTGDEKPEQTSAPKQPTQPPGAGQRNSGDQGASSKPMPPENEKGELEREHREDEAEAKPEAKQSTKPELKPDTKPDTKPGEQPELKPDAQRQPRDGSGAPEHDPNVQQGQEQSEKQRDKQSDKQGDSQADKQVEKHGEKQDERQGEEKKPAPDGAQPNQPRGQQQDQKQSQQQERRQEGQQSAEQGDSREQRSPGANKENESQSPRQQPSPDGAQPAQSPQGQASRDQSQPEQSKPEQAKPDQSKQISQDSGQPGEQSDQGTRPAGTPREGADPRSVPPDALERIAKELRNNQDALERAKEAMRSSRDMREQAKRMLEESSPQQREAMERIARELGQQADGADSGQQSRRDGSPRDLSRSRDAARPRIAEGDQSPDVRGGGAGAGTRRASAAQREAPADQGASDGTTPVDARDTRTKKSRTIAEIAQAPQHGESARTSTEGGLADAVQQAAAGAEQGIEQQGVPSRYSDLVRRVFQRYQQRVQPAKGDQSPPGTRDNPMPSTKRE